MDVARVRAGCASLVTMALLGLVASPALAAPGVAVSAVSSLQAGATAGTLTGKVVNDTDRATRAQVAVRIMRRGTRRPAIGRTTVAVPAHGSAVYRVAVKLPPGLSRGNYYLSACTAYGNGAGKLGCATARDEVLIKGGTPARGTQAASALAKAAQAETCSSGGRTLAKPGSRLYPETGNTGYTSSHTDVNLVYDAPSNLLPAGHARRSPAARDAVPDRLQPRLRAHQRRREHDDARPGPDRAVGHRQRPAGDVHVQAADVPRRPERPGRSRPAGPRGVELEPGQRDQPEPAGLCAGRRRRGAAGRAVPREQARDHAVGADPGRQRVQGRRQLHGPPRRPRRR